MEQWKLKQKQEIENLFDCYNRYVCLFDEVPPLTPWMRWCKDYICKSFENLDRRWTWIEALAMQDDDSPFMTAHGERAKAHLKLIRDYAKRGYQRPDHGLFMPWDKR